MDCIVGALLFSRYAGKALTDQHGPAWMVFSLVNLCKALWDSPERSIEGLKVLVLLTVLSLRAPTAMCWVQAPATHA